MVLVLTASCALTAIVAKDVHLKLLYAGTIGTVSGRRFDGKSWQAVRELMVSCFIAGDWSFRKCSGSNIYRHLRLIYLFYILPQVMRTD